MTARASIDDARRFLALLARPGDVFELRGLSKGRSTPIVTAGYFDDMGALAIAAVERSGKDDGVYITLNPVNPGLLARAPANRVRQAGNGDTTSDRDVQHRRHLLVDVDPIRPTGISSNDAEHAAAIELAAAIADHMVTLGWPEPMRADSGNGGHLVYAVDLPVDDGGLIKRVLAQLSRQFTTTTLKVDEKVFNPARISKIYGTLTRKGENTADRPHRIARLLAAPAALVVVTREQLEAFAPTSAPLRDLQQKVDRYADQRTGARFDIDQWIAQHVPDAISQPWSEGRKWLLPICPFNSDHARREAYITEKHGGMLAAGCQHESCFKSWRDLRLHFEPNAYERANGNSSSSSSSSTTSRVSDREPPPEVLYQDASYDAEIDAIADRDREPAPPPTPSKPPSSTGRLISIGQALEDLAALATAPIYPTPYPTLNDAIGFGGLLGTQVYTLAAGTGRGKSSWVADVAAHAAELGTPVLLVSYEMKPGYFVARKAAGVMRVHSNQILRNEVPMGDVMATMPYAHFVMMHRPTLKELRAGVDQLKQKYGVPPLVIVDYLQKLADLIASVQQRPDLRLATTEASATLLDIAEETGSAVLAVSAIGRGKGRALSNPRKLKPYELVEVAKESGAVEYDGAGMIVLSLSDEFEGDERIATMTLAKARFGIEIHIDGRYDGRRGTWRDLGRVEQTKDAETPPAPQPTNDELKRRLIASLKVTPARNKETLLKRVTGKRTLLGIAYEELIAAGVISKVGTGITLSEAGRQLSIEVSA